MRGVFGLLLIGGGIILLVGEFSGKITFPLGAAATGGQSSGPGH